MRDKPKGFSTSGRGYNNSVSPILVGILALFLLCAGGAGVFFYLSTTPPTVVSEAPVAGQPEMVEVLITVDRLEAGVALEPIQFRKESRPSSTVPTSRLSDFEQIRGAYTSSFIAAGQPLLTEFITFKKPINQIQATIPDGYRAVTMAVDETTSVEGWARAGAKVDVVLISMVNGKSTATVVVQNARVLSGGGSDNDKPREEKRTLNTVTLMVSVEEAAKIQLASSSGVISLQLRGDEDTVESPQNSSIAIDSIIIGEVKAAVEIPTEGSIKIDGQEYSIIHGKLVPRGKAQ